MLLTALATDPATPVGALNAIADTLTAANLHPDRYTGSDTHGAVLAHPALRPDHPAFADSGWPELFYALRSPLITDTRAAHLIAHTTPDIQRRYLAIARVVHPAALAFDPSRGAPGISLAAQLIAYPTAPALTVLEALRVLVTDHNVIRDNRTALLTAATRHPSHLTELAALSVNATLAAQLTAFARKPDPYQAHLDDVIAGAAGADGRWVSAILETCDERVARAGLADRPTSAVWNAVLGSHLPHPVKLQLLHDVSTVTSNGRPITPDADFLRQTAREAPSALLADLLTSGALGAEFILEVLQHAALTPEALNRVADVVLHDLPDEARRWNPLIAPYLAIHPLASATQRQAAFQLAVRDGSQLGADYGARVQAIAATGLRLVTQTPAKAGAGLPVPVLCTNEADTPAMHAIVQATLAGHRANLARPEYTQALLALEPAFTGTLTQLLTTASAITT